MGPLPDKVPFLLLVEDDPPLAEGLRSALRASGYEVDWVDDGLTAQAAMLAGLHDLIVLDRQLPGQEGLEALRRMRAAGIDTPVLVLTARDSVEDRIEGLESGADDYLVKPCDLGELRARLKALERRGHLQRRRAIVHGAIVLDPLHHRVTLRGDPIALTPSEFQLLELLLSEAGGVVSRRRILAHLYDEPGHTPDTDAIKVHVHNLRRKLGSGSIMTVRGVGYAIAEDR